MSVVRGLAFSIWMMLRASPVTVGGGFAGVADVVVVVVVGAARGAPFPPASPSARKASYPARARPPPRTARRRQETDAGWARPGVEPGSAIPPCLRLSKCP